MNDLMIDIETLGTGTDAVVLSIGAVFFDIETGKLGASFHQALDIQDQLDVGRKIDGATLKWWVGQSSEAIGNLFKHAKPSREVLSNFEIWVKSLTPPSKLYVYGNGAGFDITIMESLYKSFGGEHFWKYSKIMDLRTFKRFNNPKGLKIINKGTKHDALDDAKAQAEFVINCLKGEE